ncbi:SpoIIE family protein phosphatase [candidate division KSB1 bacterium]|nr:SpoIIE family protein phosphatase [candidate division KSB1 bacterium]
MKSIARFILLWVALFLLSMIFILPNTQIYQSAYERFDQVIVEKDLSVPSGPQRELYRHGFAVGFIMGDSPRLIVKIIVLQTLVVIILFAIIAGLSRNRSKNIVLPNPLDSVKNVFSHMLLFMFGIFNRRASDQLRYYFDLPARSRLIGLLAYTIIFIAITFSYNIPESSVSHKLLLLSYLQIVIVVTLILLVFFSKRFRKHYQKKLYWLSLTGFLLLQILSVVTGVELGQDQMAGGQAGVAFTDFLQIKTLFVNLLIVLAFSFYIEVMKQVSMQKARMDAEMSMAQRIQRDLLPELQIDNKSFQLYGQTESANEVGGDYCDAIRISDHRTAITVGDVSGHNVAAGVLMSMLKVAFRTELTYMSDPAETAASLNKTIYENKNKFMFISFLFSILDIKEQTLRLVNCGHPPLVHFVAKEQTIRTYRTGDIALGLKRDTLFQSRTIPFASGDIFIFLSDGLLETTDCSGKEFGLERLQNLVNFHRNETPRHIYKKIMTATDHFRSQKPKRDDTTLVILKIN